MTVIRVRLLPACVGALGIGVGADRHLGCADRRERVQDWRSTRPKMIPNGGSSGVTPARPGIRPPIKSMPATWRNLSVAWRFSTRNLGPRPATGMQVSPLIVDGVMYTTASVNARCGRARCGHRAVALALAPHGRPPEMERHHRPAGKNFRPRRQLLDGWRGRPADLRRHGELHAGRAGCEDRATGDQLRQERRRRYGRRT